MLFIINFGHKHVHKFTPLNAGSMLNSDSHFFLNAVIGLDAGECSAGRSAHSMGPECLAHNPESLCDGIGGDVN